MKLYQALTQVTIADTMIDDVADYQVHTVLRTPLHFTPRQIYHYIDAVLKPGARHDENNLRFVTDASFIAMHYDYQQTDFTAHAKTFDDKVTFAHQIVTDLNRHCSVNVDPEKKIFQIIFVD
ncbi:hypothetical protein [Schleiferilactobacillus shenzhenensis]|nr:hypothetical protein [Schleiferilactobacillus shenzhenensis]